LAIVYRQASIAPQIRPVRKGGATENGRSRAEQRKMTHLF
jgi:sulfur relay (sulfurtransferase) DsrC/TusE family protein